MMMSAQLREELEPLYARRRELQSLADNAASQLDRLRSERAESIAAGTELAAHVNPNIDGFTHSRNAIVDAIALLDAQIAPLEAMHAPLQ